ncbi:MAG: hypothetical protein CMH56_13015 [Myxococcales bacterium]|nr:hypothetical protein [Myxococcales bacterium]
MAIRALFLSVLGLMLVGCPDEGAAPGHLGGPCNPDGTCNGTLMCEGDVCVIDKGPSIFQNPDDPSDTDGDDRVDAGNLDDVVFDAGAETPEPPPTDRICVGDEVHERNAMGDYEFYELCMDTCVNGVCTPPCGIENDKLSYLGCSFWATRLENLSPSASYTVTLSSNGNLPIEVLVTTSTGEEVSTTTLEPGTLKTLTLNTHTQLTGSGVFQKSYFINSSGKITVHQFSNNGGGGDATLLLPVSALGTDYMFLGWATQMFRDTLPYAQKMSIIATSDNPTTIVFESPVIVEVSGLEYPANQPFEFQLNKGDNLEMRTLMETGEDLTGTVINASEKIAVFSNNRCTMIPAETYACDHIQQQLFPTNTWASEYVAAKFKPRGTEDDLWRILAGTNGTEFETMPPLPELANVTLNRGEMVEIRAPHDFVISSNHPFSLAQFMVGSEYPGNAGGCGTATSGAGGARTNCAIQETCNGSKGIGDPSFLMVVPSSQYREDYTISVPSNTVTGQVDHYLTFILPEGAVLDLNGENPEDETSTLASDELVVTPLENTTWRTLTLPMEEGTHVASADQPFGLMVYGYGCAFSYAYPGGLNLETTP